jgi:hypothetical protein
LINACDDRGDLPTEGAHALAMNATTLKQVHNNNVRDEAISEAVYLNVGRFIDGQFSLLLRCFAWYP